MRRAWGWLRAQSVWVKVFLAVAVVALLGAVAVIAVNREDLRCDSHFRRRVGHSEADDAFWDTLEQCAREGRLPDGYNDPALFAD